MSGSTAQRRNGQLKGPRFVKSCSIGRAKAKRLQFRQALEILHAGDTLVVWKLDRLGRSLMQLIETITGLQQRTIEFCSLTEHIDTASPGGKLIFHIFGALTEFERDLIRKRTLAG